MTRTVPRIRPQSTPGLERGRPDEVRRWSRHWTGLLLLGAALALGFCASPAGAGVDEPAPRIEPLDPELKP